MKIRGILPTAIAIYGLTLGVAFAIPAPEQKPEEPVISNIEEISADQLAMPIAAPQKSDAPLSEEAQKLAQPVVPPTADDAAPEPAQAVAGSRSPEEILSAAPAQSPLNGLMNTMTALNLTIVSLGRIISSGDKVVLDGECREIFANLRPGELENEPEIAELYGRLLETLSEHRLTDEESRAVARIYDTRQTRALAAALSSLKMRDLDIFFATLFSRGANSYFGYSDIVTEVHREVSCELDEETIAGLRALQKEFLAAGDALQAKYGLPENLRLTQQEVDFLLQANSETDPERALEMYSVLQSAFEYDPLFWFCQAKSAASSDVERTLACLDKFETLRRPVMHRDPFFAEATKMRIVHEEWTSNERLVELLSRFKENLNDREWIDNLFYGTVTWASGDREGGIAAVRNNIFQNLEARISGVVLAELEKENFDAENFCTAFREATTEENEISADRVALAAWLAGQDAAATIGAQQMMGERSPLPYLVAWQLLREDPEGAGDKILAAAFEEKHAELAMRDASSYAAALDEIRSAAKDGNVRAQWLLGLMYENGWGVARDVFSAARWYKLAAEGGNSGAQTAYAAMCATGSGTKKSVSEALKWYTLAAKSGDERAQFEIGRMYRTGTGVKRDLAAAAQNYLDSANAGYAPAQAALGEMYRKGTGVPKDLAESYKWSWLAKLSGEKSAEANLKDLDGRGKKSKLDPIARENAKAKAQKMYNDLRDN